MRLNRILLAPSMLSIVWSGSAFAQQAAAADADTSEDIVVSASRIDRQGYDQPTPTSVLGAVELRQGARASIQQVLNDQPQFKASYSTATLVGNFQSGTAPVDLRGLGITRTLTLINRRRFVGQNNLNFVPANLLKRVEVVTGGASAAWGSGAVAGVVNLILDDKLEGLTLGGSTGISSRGDGARYALDGSYGTKFADGRGHFMVGVEYVDDKGVLDRNSRRNLGSAGIVRANPLNPANQSTRLIRDVNQGNTAVGGLITTGSLAGQVFNADGTLRPFRAGAPLGPGRFPAQMAGGADGIAMFDIIGVATPFERLTTYARASYDVGDATLWVDVSYGRADTDNPRFTPDFALAPITVSASNPFLSPDIRGRLAAAGETSFTLGRYFSDIYTTAFKSERENKEVAVGIDGSFGRFKYNAYYDHGEVHSDDRLYNARLGANYTKALNAVSSNGQIVCAVNADANPANDDPACRPLNPFGVNAASPEALAYTRGVEEQFQTSKLDAMGATVQGDLFSVWAGPVAAAVGVEARWEEISSGRGEQSRAGGFAFPLFTSALQGGFNVKEAFGELAVPVLDVSGVIKADVNGAARYSDYSTSGGIWSWKLGGTVRLFDDLLLRATRSRDIRSPSVAELFTLRTTGIVGLSDLDSAGRTNVPGYNPVPTNIIVYQGGNQDLQPEISHTLTLGASWSPSYVPGFNVSVDYYDIKVDGAIARLGAGQLTLGCRQGSQAACDAIVRNPVTQTVEAIYANFQNLASFETRGIDIDATYVLPLSRVSGGMDGSLRMRALATYVDQFIYDTGVTRVNSAGSVGDGAANGIPKWRGTFSISYENDTIGIDTRVRYVDGGYYDKLQTNLINNRIASRTYVDLGIQVKATDRFTVFGNVNNLFDVAPPISTGGNPHFDVIGTYFTAGARLKI